MSDEMRPGATGRYPNGRFGELQPVDTGRYTHGRFGELQPVDTGRYTHGRFGASDEGELRVLITADHKSQWIIMDFDKEVTWLASTPEEILTIADTLRDNALEMIADRGPVAGNVNHPPHYGGKDDPYEAIKVIEAWGLGFCLGNTVKYIARAGKKGDAVEDLKKAAWYLNREIERRAVEGDV